MYAAKRSLKRPAIFVFLAASFILAACGTGGTTSNWPGLSTDGTNLFVAYGPGIIAFEAESQAKLWSYPEEPNSTLLFFAAPSVSDGQLVFGDYGASQGMFSPRKVTTIYALTDIDSRTPTVLWEQADLAPGAIVGSPLQVGNIVYVVTGDNYVYAFDSESQQMVWNEPFIAQGSIWGRPAYHEGILFVNSLDDTVYAIDAQSGKELWESTLGGAIVSAPVTDVDLVFVSSFDHKLHALEMATGAERWFVQAEDWVWSAPGYLDGTVVFADIKGNVFAVDGESGDELWSQQLAYPVQTMPLLVGDKVYLATEGDKELGQGMLTALSMADGSTLWEKSTPAPLYTTPVAVGTDVVVAMQGETTLLMAFDLETGSKQWEISPPQK